MFLYAKEDGSPISQHSINVLKHRPKIKKSVDIEYNVSYTVFDYLMQKDYPPCPHFLDHFLTSEVYVFSLPLDHPELSKIKSSDLLHDYCTSFLGYPKCAVEMNFEIGWVGLEKQDDLTIISNIQLNGFYKDVISKKDAIKTYRKMLNFCEKEIQHRPLYVPTADTLRKLTERFSNHPESAIMETPYTSKVLKGYKKTLLQKDIYANKYLKYEEMEFYKKD
jgi:hypothetical protein